MLRCFNCYRGFEASAQPFHSDTPIKPWGVFNCCERVTTNSYMWSGMVPDTRHTCQQLMSSYQLEESGYLFVRSSHNQEFADV